MLLRNVFILALATLIGACNNSTPWLDGQTTTATGTSTATTLTLQVSKPQLLTDNTDSVTITATAKDANNVVVDGASVSFSATSGDLATASTLTDANGQVATVLTSGANKANRTITVTATSGALTASTSITAYGTTIAMNGPTSAVGGTAQQYTVTLTDAKGVAIANQLVNVTSTAGASITDANNNGFITNAAGQVVLNVTASVSHTLTAQALGASTSLSVNVSADNFKVVVAPTVAVDPNVADSGTAQVAVAACHQVAATWVSGGLTVADGTQINFSTNRGTLYSDAACTVTASSANTTTGIATLYVKSTSVGPVRVTASDPANTVSAFDDSEFVSTTPASFSLSIDKSTINTGGSASITATVVDANTNAVKGQVVNFRIHADQGGSIDGTATTGTDGRATAVYTAGDLPTQLDGVIIEVTVAALLPQTISLTVNQGALRIGFGMSTKIQSSSNNAGYIYPGIVYVADSSGQAVVGAVVTIAVDITHYDKGSWGLSDPLDPTSPIVRVSSITGSQVVVDMACINEDTNRNGAIDSGEDLDNDGTLDPNATVVVSSPSGTLPVITGVDGSADFTINYPKDYAGWTQVRITANTSVGGSEGSHSIKLALPMSADDATSPPGAPDSPHGVNICTVDG